MLRRLSSKYAPARSSSSASSSSLTTRTTATATTTKAGASTCSSSGSSSSTVDAVTGGKKSCMKENRGDSGNFTNISGGRRRSRASLQWMRKINHRRDSVGSACTETTEASTSTTATATTVAAASGNNDDSGDSSGKRSNKKSVSFGTVVVRNYERKVETENFFDCKLGLSIGWEYVQLDPISIANEPSDVEAEHMYGKYHRGEMEITTEVERAKIFLANGYTKQQLRWALEETARNTPYGGGGSNSNSSYNENGGVGNSGRRRRRRNSNDSSICSTGSNTSSISVSSTSSSNGSISSNSSCRPSAFKRFFQKQGLNRGEQQQQPEPVYY